MSNLDHIKENDYHPGFLTDNDDKATPVIDECIIDDNVINDPPPIIMPTDQIVKSLHTEVLACDLQENRSKKVILQRVLLVDFH